MQRYLVNQLLTLINSVLQSTIAQSFNQPSKIVGHSLWPNNHTKLYKHDSLHQPDSAIYHWRQKGSILSRFPYLAITETVGLKF